MAFDIGRKKRLISEINVTPFIDVMLVLLVIFMITAPFMFNGIDLNLPKTKKVNSLNLNQEQVILSVDVDKNYYLGKRKVPFENIIDEIRKEFQIKKNILYLRADEDLKYGYIAYLMSYLKNRGVSNIALVTSTEKI
jgi:biopolymer transport protein TolR